MDDDWASGGEDEAGLGDISAIPEVKLPEQAPKPVEPSQKPAPPVNAWSARTSGDVRNALHRQQSQPRQPPAPSPRQQRRDNLPTSFAGGSARAERSNSRPSSGSGSSSGSGPGSGSGYARPTTLYVTNLPYDASENSITSFFQSQSIVVTNVRITRHANTGKIKAAFVRISPEQNIQQALSINGCVFGTRNIHVKVDGAEGNRRRDRGGSLGSVSYGGNFNARERRENSSNGWGSGQRGDRPSARADALDRRVENSKDERPRDTPQVPDPTIPTGPPPVGRKKLQLKPRTKPLPVLDVDRRAIDSPRTPTSAPPVMARDGNRPMSGRSKGSGRLSNSSEKADNADERNSTEDSKRTGEHEATDNDKDTWTAAKDFGASRQANSNPSSNKKEDDSKRPVLLNAFAALEVNDSDA